MIYCSQHKSAHIMHIAVHVYILRESRLDAYNFFSDVFLWPKYGRLLRYAGGNTVL